MECTQAGFLAGRAPRRAKGRRASTRAFVAFLVLFASLVGVAQRAAALGCVGRATAGAAHWAPAGDSSTPATATGDAPRPVAACAMATALPIVAGPSGGAAADRLLPAVRATRFSGADAPKPLLGPPRPS